MDLKLTPSFWILRIVMIIPFSEQGEAFSVGVWRSLYWLLSYLHSWDDSSFIRVKDFFRSLRCLQTPLNLWIMKMFRKTINNVGMILVRPEKSKFHKLRGVLCQGTLLAVLFIQQQLGCQIAYFRKSKCRFSTQGLFLPVRLFCGPNMMYHFSNSLVGTEVV